MKTRTEAARGTLVARTSVCVIVAHDRCIRGVRAPPVEVGVEVGSGALREGGFPAAALRPGQPDGHPQLKGLGYWLRLQHSRSRLRPSSSSTSTSSRSTTV